MIAAEARGLTIAIHTPNEYIGGDPSMPSNAAIYAAALCEDAMRQHSGIQVVHTSSLYESRPHPEERYEAVDAADALVVVNHQEPDGWASEWGALLAERAAQQGKAVFVTGELPTRSLTGDPLGKWEGQRASLRRAGATVLDLVRQPGALDDMIAKLREQKGER